MKVILLLASVLASSPAFAQIAWGQRSTAATEVGAIPDAFIGVWGTSAENCSETDDFGPMTIEKDGFSYYEVSTDRVVTKDLKKNKIQISYAVTDISSEELSINKETWEISPDQNSLVISSDDFMSLLSRCSGEKGAIND